MAVSIPTGPLPDILASIGDIARSRSAKWGSLGITLALTYDKMGVTWGQAKCAMLFIAGMAVFQKIDDTVRLLKGQNPRAYLKRVPPEEVMPPSKSPTPNANPAPVTVTVNP